jgi:signal transduction histidine kinase
MLGCHIDITERKRAEQELQQSFSRLQELSRRIVEVDETGRRNINRELHDRVGQNLYALSLNLQLIRTQLPTQLAAAVGERLADAQQLAGSTVQHIRDVMAELRPPTLDDYGLLAALRTYARPFSARLGAPVAVHGEETVPRLPLATETALFRIAQEALTNVAKHARAKRVEITLVPNAKHVTLTIGDDGGGFEAESAIRGRESWGMKIMRERAEAVGATLRIESAPGRGTRVIIEVMREPV